MEGFLGSYAYVDVNFQKKGRFLGCYACYDINFQKMEGFLGSYDKITDTLFVKARLSPSARYYKQKTSIETILLRFLWCHRESNQGHKDFQSFALPTELWHQILFKNYPIFRLGLQR